MGIFDGLFKPNVKKLEAKRDIKGLIKALDFQGDFSVRYYAVHALARIGDVEAVEPLIIAFEQSDINDTIAQALGELGDRRAVEPLLSSLERGARIFNVIWALGELGDPRAVEPLIDILNHGGAAYSRLEAARALGKLGDRRAIEHLLIALEDDNEEIQKAATISLQTLIPEEAGKFIKEVRQKRDEANKLKDEAQNRKKLKERHAVRKYLSHIAIKWWANQPVSRETAVCDSCGSSDISRDDGYLIGSYLWCEGCYFEKRVEAQIEQDPERSLGPGVFQKAQEMFGSEK